LEQFNFFEKKTDQDTKGEVFYLRAVGDAGVAPDARPITTDDSFWIASCTKLLASICALQQVEKGLVDLDEDISRILPELKDPQIITADTTHEDGYALTPAKNKITLRQLLTHTSGVGYGFMSPLLTSWRNKVGPSQEELSGLVAKTYDAPLLFEPGQGWAYGGGIDWAGIMVERLNNGQSLGSYMDEHIWTPFGMKHTTFHLDQHDEVRARLVPAALRDAEGKLIPNPGPTFTETVTEHSGGGGLWATVPDYVKVLADLISPEPKLLKIETINTILAAPQIPIDSPALLPLIGSRGGALAANAAATEAPVNYGCGGLVLTKDSEILPKGTLSWGGLPNLKWFVNRENGIAAMYASQVFPPGDKKSVDLSNEFFKEVMRLNAERKK
jgi:CubicO group peptidase (beta-lactamase class C family)